MGVGKRPEGTRQFVKSEAVVNDFRYSGAYDALLWELANNPDLANEFLEGLFPPALLEEVKKAGSVEELRQKIAAGGKNETVVDLPDKDWAAKPAPENPAIDTNSIATVEGEVVSDPRTTFPDSLPEAIAVQNQTSAAESERPAWLKEMREPTGRELLEMPKSEMALAFRLKEEGKLKKSA